MGACRLGSRGSILLILITAAAVLGSPHSRSAEPAQKVVRVGFVSPQSPDTALGGINAFWDRLRELGYVEGHDLVVEARWAENRYDQLPALMTEVLGRKVDVLVTYTTPAAVAAKNATSTIPIVVAFVGDPIRSGLAVSLARPGGNLTGVTTGFAEGFAGKWLELLQEAVPRLSTLAVIENPRHPDSKRLSERPRSYSADARPEVPAHRGALAGCAGSCLRAGGAQSSSSSTSARSHAGGAP